ncbi:hypothetical protein TTRE_0000960101 [Trichuris trichiura]|uniref:Uncharacterized protein n=1 Tax=Trichuris trichiura TaxID=36087 RepID=A0A077ZQU6_TRITR|nr:hypothetical protein TTRE_0000960101 [Trichuris trichiura]
MVSQEFNNPNITPYLLILAGIATLAKRAQIPRHRYLTNLYFRLIAFYEKDLKKIVTYSTIPQIALVIFIIYTK